MLKNSVAACSVFRYIIMGTYLEKVDIINII